jgi:hypothetical protein
MRLISTLVEAPVAAARVLPVCRRSGSEGVRGRAPPSPHATSLPSCFATAARRRVPRKPIPAAPAVHIAADAVEGRREAHWARRRCGDRRRTSACRRLVCRRHEGDGPEVGEAVRGFPTAGSRRAEADPYGEVGGVPLGRPGDGDASGEQPDEQGGRRAHGGPTSDEVVAVRASTSLGSFSTATPTGWSWPS